VYSVSCAIKIVFLLSAPARNYFQTLVQIVQLINDLIYKEVQNILVALLNF
jgi:hypothetical protein